LTSAFPLGSNEQSNVIISVSRLTPKSEPPLRASTTPLCPSTHFACGCLVFYTPSSSLVSINFSTFAVCGFLHRVLTWKLTLCSDPNVLITSIIAQLTALPLGKALGYVLPTTRFNTFGYVWSLNPGPFNIKEHVVITVMANVVVGGAYATDVVATQRFFYHQSYHYSYQMTLVLSTQLLGFSLGGMLRRLVVWPSSMIWPGALVNAALFNTLHRNYGRREKRHMSREKFFFIATACSFVWYWVPGYLWTGLSVFNWVCWIAPNNVAVNALFGTSSGLGMGVLTFDWSMISFIGSPLVTPVCSLVVCTFFGPLNCLFCSGGPRPIRLWRWSSSSGSFVPSFTVCLDPRSILLIFMPSIVSYKWMVQQVYAHIFLHGL
jgi:hypothetical protein